MKIIKNIFILFWNEGPRLYFWISLLGLSSLFHRVNNPGIYWLITPFAIISLLIIVLKIVRELRTKINENSISSKIQPVTIKRADYIKVLTENLPSNGFLKEVYTYGKRLAEYWATDGQLYEINIYINYDGDIIDRSVQIFIYSKTRREMLTKQLPINVDRITDNESLINQQESSKAINEYPKLQNAFKKIIELASTEINKSDSARIQISPSSKNLNINFYLKKGIKEWADRYQYSHECKIIKNNLELMEVK